MMPVRFLYIMLVAELVAQTAEAQYKNVRFTHLTTNQGLSQNNVTCILQDRRGFMWFGTRDGLNKYDGYAYTLYRNDPQKSTTISHSYIHTLFEDKQGRLWVGTNGGGLSLFDTNTERFINYQHTPGLKNSLSHNKVMAIAQDAQGFLWVGTAGGGLDRFDPRQKSFTHFSHQPANPTSLSHNMVNTLCIDRTGAIWVGTSGGGLNRLDPLTNTFHQYRHNPADGHSLSHNTVNACFEDTQGRLWVGTEGGGLNRFDTGSATFTHYQKSAAPSHRLTHNDVVTVAEDKDRNLWIGTRNGGINVLHPDGAFSYYASEEADSGGLNNGSIYALYRDRVGTMWVGTYSGGVNKLDGAPQKFKLYQRTQINGNNLTNSNILAVRENKRGDLWLGTDGGGVNVLKKGQTAFTAYTHSASGANSIGSNYVLTIYEDADGRIWTGNFKGGLNVFDRSRNTFTSIGAFNQLTILALLQARNGMMWLGTDGEGLIQYNPATGALTRYRSNLTQADSLHCQIITTLWEDPMGRIWIGTEGNGVNVFHPAENRFTHYVHDRRNPNSISNNLITVLFESAAGQLWIGTDGGLNRFDARTQTFKAYRQPDGLPSEVIQGILEDKGGTLWLSTNKGLTTFNPKTHAIRNFDTSDGLQGSAFNRMASYESPTGQLFFGGVSGLNSFYPDSIRYNRFIPPVYITDFQIFNQSVSVQDESSPLKKTISETRDITLSYQQSVLSFGFAALNYTVSGNNQYAYKLEGFDKNWINAGTRRTATYTNLDPGNYVFRVKASNNDGVWNQRGTFVNLHITPPVWQTRWFRSLAVLLLVGSLYGAYRLRVTRIQAQRVVLQHQVRQQKQTLQEQALHMQLLQAEVAQQAAQQQVQASEQRFREIADNVDEVFWIHSADPFRLMYINPAGQRVWNATFEQLQAEPFFLVETAVPEDRPTVRLFMEQYQAGLEGEVYYRLQTKDEPIRWLMIRSFIIRDEAGTVLRHIGFASDVTSQKEKEFVLQQSLQREQELNQLKSQFVSTASHEFRTPLTTIQSSVELIKLYLDIPAASARVSMQKHLGVIEKQIDQFTELLTDVLTIGQIEAGKLAYTPRSEDVMALCEHLIATHFSLRTDERFVQLVSEGIPRRVDLDAKRMEHVLINLLSNAFKFSKKASPTLRVVFEPTCLQLQVIDQGIGIPAADMAHLFQAFFRASNTIGIQGTGLGLVIARQFVELHAGTLEAQSEPHKGTIFTILLPLGSPDPDQSLAEEVTTPMLI